MDGELTIKLATIPSQRPFYTCGDLVKGSVVQRRRTNKRGVRVSIKFTGSTRSKIGPRGNIHQSFWSHDIILFQFSQDLLRSNCSPNGNTYSWPFQFTFPFYTLSMPKEERFSSDENFHRGPGHSLPPSWSGGSQPGEAKFNSVFYQLEVIIVEGATQIRRQKDRIVLPFCQLRETRDYHSILTPIVQPVSRLGHLLNHSFRGHGHTISSHAQAIYNTTWQYAVRIELPEIMCVGSQIPMFIGVDSYLSRRADPSIPAIFLKRLLITLETQTHVRVPAGFLGLRHEPHESWSETHILADGCPLHLPLPDSVDVNSFIQEVSINESLTPTFKTYNIARTYVLHLKVEVECAQKCYELNMDRKLFLLPAIRQYTGVEMDVLQARELVSLVDEPPPPYEELESPTGGGLMGGRPPSFDTAMMAG